PVSGRGGEDHVVARPDGHLDAGGLPPVDALTDRQHDPVLRRGLRSTRRYDQTGVAHAVRVELLDHDLVKERAEKLLGHARKRICWGPRRTAGLPPTLLDLLLLQVDRAGLGPGLAALRGVGDTDPHLRPAPLPKLPLQLRLRLDP